MLEILFRSVAEQELREAYRWYEDQRTGLGEDFLLCVEAAVAKARRSPELYPEVHKNVRRVLVRRFPYGIFYVVEP